MVQIVEGNNFWRDIGMQAGEGFTQGYNQRSDDTAIRNALDALPSDSNPRAILSTILGTKASPEAKKRASEGFIKGVELEQSGIKAKAEQAKVDREQREKEEKLQREKQNVDAIIDASDLAPEQKEAYKKQITSETAARQVAKPPKQERISEFDKVVQKKNAEQYIKATDDLPRINDSLQTIDKAEGLVNKLFSGLSGYAEAAVGSQNVAELNSLGFAILEPIVKVFNPTGPIAQKKLEQLQKIYAINAWDTKRTMRGKLKAMKGFGEQAKARAQEKLNLYDKYKGNPPEEVVRKFYEESDKMTDAMLDYNPETGEERTEGLPPELPPAEAFKGKTITSPEGKRYQSNGTKWMAK